MIAKEKPDNTKFVVMGMCYVVAAVLLLLIGVLPDVIFSDSSDSARNTNEIVSNSTASSGISGTFTKRQDGIIFIYKFNPDGKFTEHINTPSGNIDGQGTYKIEGENVILEGVSKLYGTNGKISIPRIDIYDK